METQAFRFALILLSSLTLSTFAPVSVAQIQDYSMLNLPDGAIARLGKGGVSYSDRGIAFSPDGNRLAVATSIGVWLYDAETSNEIALLTGHKEEVTTVAFSPDGTKLASGSDDTTIRLWEIPSGKALHSLGGENTPRIGVRVLPAPRPGEDVNEFQTDDAVDIENETISESVRSVAFSSDGIKLASESDDATVRLWDILTQKYIVTFLERRYAGWSVASSPDGTKLASGSRNDTVGLWDVLTRKHIATFPGHTGNVRAVAFSPDGSKLASGSLDGTVLLWKVSE